MSTINNIKFINLTPHDIMVYNEAKDTVILTIPTEGKDKAARRDVKEVLVGTVNGINLVKTEFTEVMGLPEPKDGVVYLVSRLVKDGILDRDDVMCPDTGKSSVRDEGGHIIGVTRFTY